MIEAFPGPELAAGWAMQPTRSAGGKISSTPPRLCHTVPGHVSWPVALPACFGIQRTMVPKIALTTQAAGLKASEELLLPDQAAGTKPAASASKAVSAGPRAPSPDPGRPRRYPPKGGPPLPDSPNGPPG